VTRDLDPVALLHGMLAIPSPSGAETTLAWFLRDHLHAAGLSARVDDVGNLVLRTGTGAGPTVLLLGHLDTVSDDIAGPVPVRRQHGVLHGRGAVDAKSPLAAMLCAASARRAFPGTLLVVGAVGEETEESPGAWHLTRTLAAPHVVVIGEPSGWSGITLGYKGQLVVEYEVTCPSAHSAHPGVKAAHLATEFWQAVAERFPAIDPGEGLFHHTTATLLRATGTITHAQLRVDLRTAPGTDPDGLLAWLAERAHPGKVRATSSVPAVLGRRSTPLARAFAAAVREHGGTPTFKVKTGTSDMNVVAGSWPVPMVAYGPGDSTLDHAPNEQVSEREYLRGIQVLGSALDALPGLLAGGDTR
jgi:LysW-gamma-L-lysine carboxypeptidase